jgi:hypothetical protein
MKFSLLLLLPFLAVSCATLPNPAEVKGSQSDPAATAILKKSAAAHGDPWKRLRNVKVSFDGEWTTLAKKVQPVLTDPDFRKTSVESYRPGRKQVSQTHTGPGGTKTVERNGDSVSVSYNGTNSNDPEKLDAAALVTDAYTILVFGSSWLAENATNLKQLPSRELDGEPCHLVAGTLKPGIGRASEDQFIAWISEDTHLLKRFQFTLNGLESTRGADVEVTFLDMKKAPDGTVWPTHFIERLQRPFQIKAHEWRTTALALDGKSAF